MFRVVCLSSLLSLMVNTSVGAEDVKSAILGCKKVGDSLERLVCYDRVAKDINKLASHQTQAIAPASKPITQLPPAEPIQGAQQVEEKGDSEFGLVKKEKPKKTTSTIYSDVVEVTKDPYGKLRITLANDQVWKQTESSRMRIKQGQRIYVERGFLGSYFMSRDEVKGRLKVKRIK